MRGRGANGEARPTRHPWQKHGGYGLLRMLSRGTLSGASRHGQHLAVLLERLAADVAGGWEALSMQQRLLVEQAAVKAMVCAVVAADAIRRGVVEDGKLIPSLGEHYLAWSGELRRDLAALGIERKEKVVLDLGRYVETQYGQGSTPAPPRETAPTQVSEGEGASYEP